jgi:hypothetical protein
MAVVANLGVLVSSPDVLIICSAYTDLNSGYKAIRKVAEADGYDPRSYN